MIFYAHDYHTGEQTPVEVDDADWGKVKDYSWYVKYQHGKYIYSSDLKLLLHRYLLNPPSHLVIDHIDGNSFNNKRSNMRSCTRRENCCNTKRPVNNTSGYKGVTWDKERGKWAVKIKVHQKYYNLGRFTDPKEAFEVYCEAGRKAFGEFFRAE